MLSQCKLNLSENDKLPSRATYIFLCDDAVPLSPNLMNDDPGAQEKGSQEKIFNYRFSRARRVSKNVFGILSARFRVFWKIFLLEPFKVQVIVPACVHLHNNFRKVPIQEHHTLHLERSILNTTIAVVLFLKLVETKCKTILHFKI